MDASPVIYSLPRCLERVTRLTKSARNTARRVPRISRARTVSIFFHSERRSKPIQTEGNVWCAFETKVTNVFEMFKYLRRMVFFPRVSSDPRTKRLTTPSIRFVRGTDSIPTSRRRVHFRSRPFVRSCQLWIDGSIATLENIWTLEFGDSITVQLLG